MESPLHRTKGVCHMDCSRFNMDTCIHLLVKMVCLAGKDLSSKDAFGSKGSISQVQVYLAGHVPLGSSVLFYLHLVCS